MSGNVPRVRMFAGPNGSGKSTLKDKIPSEGLPPDWLGIYVNADLIERTLKTQNGRLSLVPFGISTTSGELQAFFAGSELMLTTGLLEMVGGATVENGEIALGHVKVDSYLAAVLADFIRTKLLEARATFSFETVMSNRDKIELLSKARSLGYRAYLYFVATEDPEINIGRIAYRVSQGGHPVPEGKVRSRYARSLDLLLEAIRNTDRAYIFDNTSEELVLVAEVTDGKHLTSHVAEAPAWFDEAVLKKVRTA
ncbi:MAG TPA: hypothetical protein V6D47_13570 [Oscillatoriaceae cyanobacterium]